MRPWVTIVGIPEPNFKRTVRATPRESARRIPRSLLLSACFSLIPFFSGSWKAFAEEAVPWQGTAAIEFFGTSTLHDFSGRAACKPFAVRVTTDDNGRPLRISARAEVPASTMNTANEKRDAKMHLSMRIVEFPLIAGSVTDLPFEQLLGDGKGDGTSPVVTLPFTLNLLGKNHDIEATVKNWRLTENRADCVVTFSLSLKTCGIVVPPVVKIIRVGDTIDVRAAVTLTRAASE